MTSTRNRKTAIRSAVFALSLLPFLWLLFRAATDRLTANPIEDITLTTGVWALRFLLLTLAITPLRRISGWNGIIQYRRMIGLFAFFYAVLHVLTWVVLDQFFAWESMLKDVAKRPFITMGMLAFVLLIPLAVTSTKGWIRRLGRQWQTLHRLIYLAAIAAVFHFLWKVKVAAGEPVYYAAILALLLAFRVVWRLRARASARRYPAEA